MYYIDAKIPVVTCELNDIGKQIVSLTQKQEDKFSEYVEKWTKIGLCTEPIDFEKSKELVKQIYKNEGLNPPEKMVYCESPLVVIKKITKLKNIKNFNDFKILDWFDILDFARISIQQCVNDFVWDSVRGKISQYVMGSIYEDLGGFIFCSLDSKFESFIFSTLKGQHYAGSLSIYDYFRNECELIEETDEIQGIIELAKTTGWVYLYKDIAFICDRHNKINLDKNGRLHSENDYAFQYPDGFRATYWHGIEVPEWIIFEKDKITIEKILEEKDEEIQKCMTEISCL